MGVLLSPANPIRKGTKWALVAHTVAMFLFLTIATGIGLNYSSISYINNRGFPGNNELPSGPLGYDAFLTTTVVTTVYNVMFPLNQWLADGLLVGLISGPVAQAFNVGRSSCNVAISFMP